MCYLVPSCVSCMGVILNVNELSSVWGLSSLQQWRLSGCAGWVTIVYTDNVYSVHCISAYSFLGVENMEIMSLDI